MAEDALVVLVSQHAATVGAVREALGAEESRLTLQHIERARTAVARIGGGGVAALLLDNNADDHGREAFAALRAAAPEIPLIILSTVENEAYAAQMVEEGALSHLLRPSWQRDLKTRILEGIARREAASEGASRTNGRKGRVIAVQGSKGGVGATTVATNLASLLASTAKTVLAELRPPFGSLCHFFRPHRATRGLQNLVEMRPDQIGASDVESCLWPDRTIPGLSVLFAPDKPDGRQTMEPDQAAVILARLSKLSEMVVVDLPPTLSDTDRTILKGSDTLILAVERDALSVDAAKTKLKLLEQHGLVPREAGLVIVNRVALASPAALADIESQLGIPLFAVIPPAADLCASAYRVHTPVVKLDDQSLMAASLVQLGKKLSGRP